MNCLLQLSRTAVLIIILTHFCGRLTAIEPSKDESKVRDSVITLDTSLGTVSVHESLEGGRYYVAPKFRFLFVQPKNEVIAQIAALPLAGSTTVQMRLEVINSASRRQVLEELNKTVDKKIVATDVRNLEVDGIIIRLASEDQESEYRVKPCIIRHPQPSSETLDLVFSVAKKTSHEFIKMVNDGKITFNVSYTYNKISIDSRVEELSATTLIDTKAVRDLKMDGSEVMTAKQFADFSKTIQNEITSKVILGFGKIEMESIPVTKLMDLFKVGDLVSMTAKQIEDADRTAAATTNLKVDPKEFQPFKYQKKVVETLASDKTIEEHKKEYATLYTAEKVKIHASASGKAGGGIWSAKAKGEYDKETEKKVSEGKLTDEEFKDHIQTYHGVEYTEQLVQRRGLEIYSVEKVRAMGTTKIISVTIRPTLTTGIKSTSIAPSKQTIRSAQFSSSKIVSKRDAVVAPGGPGRTQYFADFEVYGNTELPECLMVKLQVRSISADAKTLPDFDCTLAFTCRDTNKIVGVAPLALERVVFYQPPDGGLNLAQCGLALSAKFDKESHRYVYNVIVAADNSIAITQSNADYEFIATVEAMPMFGKRK